MPRFTPAQARFVRSQPVCRLATLLGPRGLHVVPVCPILDRGSIVFATDLGTRKLENLKRNPGVALVFDEYGEEWERLRGVMIQGRATRLHGAEWRRAYRLLRRKFPQYREEPFGPHETAMVRVRPSRIVSWGL